MSKIYLAYGSNMNLKQMEHRCPTSEKLGTTELLDYELQFRGVENNAHLTIEPCKGKSIPVVLFAIEEEDERKLDRYEGVRIGCYTKENLTVTLNGREIEALVYIMAAGRTFNLPSDHYYEVCCQGYKDNGFDLALLEEALQKSKNPPTEEPEIEEEEFIMKPSLQSISLKLYGGTFNDVALAHNNYVSSVVVYSVPREKIYNSDKLRATDENLEKELNRAGIYILYGTKDGIPEVYVGQATNGMLDRIKAPHSKGTNDFYDKAYCITTFNNCLNETDLNYLEDLFIKNALEIKHRGHWGVRNKTKGKSSSADKFKKADLERIYEFSSLLLLTLLLPQFHNLNMDTEPSVTPFTVTEENQQGAKPKKPAINSQDILTFSSPNFSAKAHFAPSGLFVVHEGSKIKKETTAAFATWHLLLREKYKKFLKGDGNSFIVTQDLEFDSPSAAASFVAGSNRSGWNTWKDKEGKTLKERKS